MLAAIGTNASTRQAPKKWLTFSSSPGLAVKPQPDRAPHMMSTQTLEAVALVAGALASSRRTVRSLTASIAACGSVVGMARPGRAPRSAGSACPRAGSSGSCRTRPWSVAMSSTNGGSSPHGTATEIGFVPSFGVEAAERHDARRDAVGQRQPDHVVLERHPRVDLGHAVVAGVADRGEPGADLARPLDHVVHDACADDEAHAPIRLPASRSTGVSCMIRMFGRG